MSLPTATGDLSSGRPPEPIVAIHAPDSATGVAAEYDNIESRFGVRGQHWNFVRQLLMRLDPGRWLDVIDIKLADGTPLELRFDITEFCGLSSGLGAEADVGDDDDAPTIGELLAERKPR